MDDEFHAIFARELQLEASPGHEMFQMPARLIGRGQGDDALFELLDGSGRVAVVDLTWAQVKERLPWPVTTVYGDMQEWIQNCMLCEHQDWAD